MKERKKGTFAMYNGQEYKAAMDYQRGAVILYSNNPNDAGKGFRLFAPGKYWLFVKPDVLADAYEIQVYAAYAGRTFSIFQEQPDRLLLTTGEFHQELFDLGFVMAEPSVYEKWVSTQEIEGFVQKKKPIWGFEKTNEGVGDGRD